MVASQIKSKKRVKELAEVYTNEREVNAMLDLIPINNVKEQLDFTYLEPACGNGNFLIKILERKLNSIEKQESFDNSLECLELMILKSISTIYAIDICNENIKESKARLFNSIMSFYNSKNATNDTSEDFIKSIDYVLNTNIVQGNSIDEKNNILFSEYIFDQKLIQEKVFSFNDIGKEDIKPVKELNKIMYGKVWKNKKYKKELYEV